MPLTPTERDRVPLFTAARPARVRRARGLRLAVAGAAVLIADAVCGAARGGHRPAVALERGRSALTSDGIPPGVADVVTGIHAYGMRSAAPAGVSTRLDAGGTVGVGLVPMGRVRTATRRRIGIVRPPPPTRWRRADGGSPCAAHTASVRRAWPATGIRGSSRSTRATARSRRTGSPCARNPPTVPPSAVSTSRLHFL